jgi:hypothetical protein
MTNYVEAYGNWKELMDYEDAYLQCAWHIEHDKDHGLVGLARVAKEAFELVAFGEEPDGSLVGMQDDYVTVADGRRLIEAGVADIMVLASSREDFDDPETFARLRKEQLED